MVGVRVIFAANGQNWTHDFHVDDGANIIRLKETMLVASEFTRDDVNSFELVKKGKKGRIPDYEQIWENTEMEWNWLGPDEGNRRAAADENIDTRWREDQHKRDAIQRQQAAMAESRAREQRAQEEKEKAEQERMPEMVKITVSHALPEMQSSITVEMMDSATLNELRKLVMEKIGTTRESEVKLVRKVNKGGEGGTTVWCGVDYCSKIAHRRDFWCMGPKKLELIAPEEPPAALGPDAQNSSNAAREDFVVRLHSSTDDTELELQVKATSRVSDLKLEVCELIKRGTPDKVSVAVPSRSLRDNDKLEDLRPDELHCLLFTGFSLAPPASVEVTVRHSISGHSVTVSVWDTSTGKDVRDALADRLDTAASNIHFVSFSDRDLLGDRREVKVMGSALTLPPPPPKVKAALEAPDLNITVYMDRALDLKFEVTVKEGSRLQVIKEELVNMDPTGNTQLADIGLRLCARQGEPQSRPLANSTLLSWQHLELEVCPVDDLEEGQILLTHAIDGSTLKVQVGSGKMSLKTVMDLRQAAMAALGTGKLKDVALYVEARGCPVSAAGCLDFTGTWMNKEGREVFEIRQDGDKASVVVGLDVIAEGMVVEEAIFFSQEYYNTLRDGEMHSPDGKVWTRLQAVANNESLDGRTSFYTIGRTLSS